MTRIVTGPYVAGMVFNKGTGSPMAGVTVVPSAPVYTSDTLTTIQSTTTTFGDGRFRFYAPPGVYTFTCPDPNAGPIESVEVLSPDEGTAGLNKTTADAVYAPLTTTATLEELETHLSLPASISATATQYLGPVNFDARIGALSFSFSAAVAASDTNLWTVSLVRYRKGAGPVVVATLTTGATLGVGITANQAWTFDNVAWTSFRYLLKGDILALTFTTTGAPAALVNGQVAYRYEPNVVATQPLITDAFARSDSTTTMGSTDTGQPWVPLFYGGFAVPTWGIKSNAASVHAIGGTNRDYTAIDMGALDCTVQATILVPSQAGLILRSAVTATVLSGYQTNSTALVSTADGSTFAVLGTFSQAIVAGDVLTCSMAGNMFTVYRNGTQVLQVTDATYKGEMMGIRASAPTLDTALVSNFSISVP